MAQDLSNNAQESPERTKGETSFRRALSQVLACTANNLMVLDDGLALSFSTIALAALYDNPDEPFNLTSDEASWFASLALLFQPIGSIISGLIVEPLGRKRAMLLLNIIFFIGWTMIYFAESANVLYAASSIMGFGIGCTEAPILTYVGEICEPKYRGALTAYVQLWWQLGCLIVYAIGSALSWRYTAAFCALVPLITALAISRIPETPLWLISRGKIQAAEEALCWLRGWTKPDAVQEELHSLIEYNKSVNEKKQQQIKNPVPVIAGSQDLLIEVKMPLKQRIIYFFRPEMRRPLVLIICYFFFVYASGFQTIRPYFMYVFNKLNISMDHYQVTMWTAVIGFIGTILCSVAVSYTGKKPLSLISLAGCALCTLGLALVAYLIFSASWAVPLLFAFSFFTSLGVAAIPWMLQSELYPFQGKCLAAGIASAASYIIGFIAIKTFFGLEEILQLSGVFVLFTCLSVFGLIYLSVRLPETEGQSFDIIESKFVK